MIDWDRLISFKVLDEIDCMIIKAVYDKDTLSSLELFNKFRMVNISKSTMLNKLHRLGSLGLMDIVKSKPLFTHSKFELQENISKLLFIKQKRKELVSKYFNVKFDDVREVEEYEERKEV